MAIYMTHLYFSSVSLWGLVNSYCRKAKSVFRELDQVPYVVELDERGVF